MILHVHEYETASVSYNLLDVSNITHCRDKENKKKFFPNFKRPHEADKGVPFDESTRPVAL